MGPCDIIEVVIGRALMFGVAHDKTFHSLTLVIACFSISWNYKQKKEVSNKYIGFQNVL